jgi:hypothetical protein
MKLIQSVTAGLVWAFALATFAAAGTKEVTIRQSRGGVGKAVGAKGNKLPDAARAILARAEQLELLSLDPTRREKPKDGFHGWEVLGKTVLKDKDMRKVLAAVEQGIARSDGSAARCFIPRHGIRASHGKRTVDLVICFECLQIQVYLDNTQGKTVLTTDAPQDLLNRVLMKAKVPLAPPRK